MRNMVGYLDAKMMFATSSKMNNIQIKLKLKTSQKTSLEEQMLVYLLENLCEQILMS